MKTLVGIFSLVWLGACTSSWESNTGGLPELPAKKGVMQMGRQTYAGFRTLNKTLKIIHLDQQSRSEEIYLRTVGLDPRIVVRCGLRHDGNFLGGFFSRVSFQALTSSLLISPPISLSFQDRKAELQNADGKEVLLSCTCEDADGFEAKVSEKLILDLDI